MNQFAIDRRNGVLLVTFSGSVTPESLGAFAGEVKGFITREDSMAAIIDFTGVVLVELEASVAANLGKSGRPMPGKPRVFVTASPLLFGLLRIYGAYQDGNGERAPAVVRSLAEAFQELALTDRCHQAAFECAARAPNRWRPIDREDDGDRN